MSFPNTTPEDGAMESPTLVILLIFYSCLIVFAWCLPGESQIENRRAFIRRAMITRTWKAHLTAQDAFSSTNSNEDDDDDDDVENDATDSRNECPICWNSFHHDSLICESNNPACSHVYDACCMEQWLMTHDVCPICRECYLIVEPV
jgi:hypothetical protein